MKLLIIFVFGIYTLYAADVDKKDVNYTDLFNQLDKVISAKKDNKSIKKSKEKHEEKNVSKREKNYQKFNEAAKKYHIFRASKILVSVENLIIDYKNRTTNYVNVERYSFIGNKKFAYVSSEQLNVVLEALESNGKILKNLKNYEALLKDLKEFDIKTISKVLIIVEQEIMNIRGMGIKKVSKLVKKDSADIPLQIKSSMFFKNVKVIDINQNVAKLKVMAL